MCERDYVPAMVFIDGLLLNVSGFQPDAPKKAGSPQLGAQAAERESHRLYTRLLLT